MIATDFQAINIVLEQIRRLGIKVAIDDFGTGYSTLARERELQVDCLKIDKLFIDNLLFLSPQEAITADIISMAHKLGHCVVAEGVEHRSQWEYLETHDCDMVQGYLISEPVDGDVAFRMLSQNMLHPIEMVSEEPLK
jgi:EAL domain-containing protein (putative c-di-GMP-specific phosphodiesterase class I)